MDRQVWIVPALGMSRGAARGAMIRDSDGTLSGLWMARLALPLSLLFFSAAVARSVADRYYLLHTTTQLLRPIFAICGTAIRIGQSSGKLTVSNRRPMDGLLWDYFRQEDGKSRQVRNFVEQTADQDPPAARRASGYSTL